MNPETIGRADVHTSLQPRELYKAFVDLSRLHSGTECSGDMSGRRESELWEIVSRTIRNKQGSESDCRDESGTEPEQQYFSEFILARDEIVRRYLPFVERWAKNIQRSAGDIDDWYGECMEILLHSIAVYDIEAKGCFEKFLQAKLGFAYDNLMRRTYGRTALEKLRQGDQTVANVLRPLGIDWTDRGDEAELQIADPAAEGAFASVESGVRLSEALDDYMIYIDKRLKHYRGKNKESGRKFAIRSISFLLMKHGLDPRLLLSGIDDWDFYRINFPEEVNPDGYTSRELMLAFGVSESIASKLHTSALAGLSDFASRRYQIRFDD